jgi:hypothetical protein
MIFGALSTTADGLEMGITADGTPFLTGRGLAKLCGVDHSTIRYHKDEWADGKRGGKLAKMFVGHKYTAKDLCEEVVVNGTTVNAYPDHVCMIFLEYFAFEAEPRNDVATDFFRKLAHSSLRQMIYLAMGYDPARSVPEEWRQFHDRQKLHTTPKGYFSVFQEMSGLVLESIRVGLPVDHHTVPDISVGMTWATFWNDHKYDEVFGKRVRHDHNYPEYFPQAKSNPQEMWIYPNEALGEFRRWMDETYLPEKFPSYLASKVKKGLLSKATVDLLLAGVANPDAVIAELGA